MGHSFLLLLLLVSVISLMNFVYTVGVQLILHLISFHIIVYGYCQKGSHLTEFILSFD